MFDYVTHHAYYISLQSLFRQPVSRARVWTTRELLIVYNDVGVLQKCQS